ncbi:MAG: hypothetical protein ABIF10_04140 [Candidatus Woesearchaeota archaeon]
MVRVQTGSVDAVSIGLIVLGGFILYQGNSFGWFFILLGIVKNFSGW